MDSTHTRNKLNLYRNKIVPIIILLVGMSTTGVAQLTKRYNMPTYDDRLIHYGFQLALNNSGFRVRNSDVGINDTTISGVTTSNPVSFTLGFVFNYRLNDYMDLRALPQVGFYERHVKYTYSDGTPELDNIFESTFIELPLMLKYKSARRVNHRFYMLGGIKPMIEVGAKKKEKKDTQLRTKTFDLALEYGIGFDKYNELFKFSPEIRFSMGLMNLLIKDDNEFANHLEKISTFTVTFAILFE